MYYIYDTVVVHRVLSEPPSHQTLLCPTNHRHPSQITSQWKTQDLELDQGRGRLHHADGKSAIGAARRHQGDTMSDTMTGLKEQSVILLDEDTVDPLQGATVDPLKGDTVDPLEEDTVDPLEEDIVGLLDEEVVVASDGRKKRARRIRAAATAERRTGDWSEDIDLSKSATGGRLVRLCAMEAESLTRP